ncbi:MAG: hypothetical protein CEN91_430 [Candidatus Berkelbacteria bacterium Licking1014_85]|uniref:Uncharacterized protein n=1 Tax=Candidatus Berkelbacteria bacterium Licking1014_85 TaxID=2017148 RepID=A0A554LHZ1_9BACT|nr:MAG: hypothetical protein CEN91_430 [Candidatus Berkelbacteria bacterium Licking1014_85]
MSKKELETKQFKSEDKEREYWSKIDLTDYFDKNDFGPVYFSNLKPTTSPISIRIPNYLIIRVKEQANALNIPYQSLIKEYIADGVEARK